MPYIGKLSVWIEAEGERLREYASDYASKTKTKTCWIPSEAGKKFKIYCQDDSRRFTTAYTATMDGQDLPFCDTIEPQYDSDSPMSFSGIDTMHGTMPFVFSTCTYVEEDAPNVSIRVDTSIGDIEVVVWRARILRKKIRKTKKQTAKQIRKQIPVSEPGPCESEPSLNTADLASAGGPVSLFPELLLNERGKKGIVHGIQLGDITPKESLVPPMCTGTGTGTGLPTVTPSAIPVETPEAGDSDSELEGYSQEVKLSRRLATFVFKYRPFDVLLAAGFVRKLRLPRGLQPPGLSPVVNASSTPQTDMGDVAAQSAGDEQMLDPELDSMMTELSQLKKIADKYHERANKPKQNVILKKEVIEQA